MSSPGSASSGRPRTGSRARRRPATSAERPRHRAAPSGRPARGGTAARRSRHRQGQPAVRHVSTKLRDVRRAGCRRSWTAITSTNPHSGRENTCMRAGATIASAATALARNQVRRDGPVPQLGNEVGEGQDHERQRRVVVVLERGPVDARPRDPLRGEAHRDEHQAQAAPLERLVGDERHRRDAEPPDREVAGVVDRRRRAVAEAALVEPDRLEVERPRPPRRRRGVGRRELVVVAVHLAGQVEQGLAGVAGGPARHDLVAVERGPGQVRDDVDNHRQHDQARAGPHDRDPEQPARAQPAGGR